MQPNIIEEAVNLREKGRYADAIDLLEKSLADQPASAEAYALQSHLYILNAQIDKAWKSIQHAQEISPDLPIVLRNRARLLLTKNQHDDALAIALRAYQLEPHVAENLLVVSGILIRRNNIDQAEQLIELILKDNPRHAEALINRAVISNARKKFPEALAYLEAALATKPHLHNLWGFHGDINLAQKEFYKAAGSFERALQHDAKNLDYLSKLAELNRMMGLYDAAIDHLVTATRHYSDKPEIWLNLGRVYQQKGESTEAKKAYEISLRLEKNQPEIFNNLGVLEIKNGAWDQSIAYLNQAIAARPDFAEAKSNLQLAIREKQISEGKRSEVGVVSSDIGGFETISSDPADIPPSLKPEFAMVSNFCKTQSFSQAEAHLHAMLQQNPMEISIWKYFGQVLSLQGKFHHALTAFEKAHQILPTDAYTLYLIANTLLKFDNQEQKAIQFYKNAIHANPRLLEAYVNLGTLYYALDLLDEAKNCFLNVLTINPEYAEILSNLGNILREQGKTHEAIEYLQIAIKIKPFYLNAHNNLGLAYKDAGQLDQAISSFLRALEIKPDYIDGRSNLMLAMVYAPNIDQRELTNEAIKYNVYLPEKLSSPHYAQAFPNPKKILHIGYVSADFRKHAVSYFIEDILKNHDATEYKIFCYYNNIVEDAVTETLKNLVPEWRPIKHLNDDAVASLVEKDQIDILIDLSGHTSGNRLKVFAKKPAPVQVTYLGYPATTGLKAIDYRITDRYAEPPSLTEHLSVEALWRLPEIFCCYRPSPGSPDVVSQAPYLSNGAVTFGCLNNFSKVTDQVIGLWGLILQAVPNSRLLLEIKGLENLNFKADVCQRFARLGISEDRLILIPREAKNQYVLYNQIDIALDPFPCNGGTTSFDSLWMGVPFITLAGRHFVSRMGVTILSNIGLDALIAESESDYLSKAVDLAMDTNRLNHIRYKLREKMMASPLMDSKRFVMNLEQAYRSMWLRYCEQNLMSVDPTK
jgi:protein O-GlcNAc transferase